MRFELVRVGQMFLMPHTYDASKPDTRMLKVENVNSMMNAVIVDYSDERIGRLVYVDPNTEVSLMGWACVQAVSANPRQD